MTPLARLHVAQQRQKDRHIALVEQIIGKLPEPRFNRANMLTRLAGQINPLVDELAEKGIYRPRVSYRLSGNRTAVISEPMDGVDVPRLEHGYGGHPLAWVRVIEERRENDAEVWSFS